MARRSFYGQNRTQPVKGYTNDYVLAVLRGMLTRIGRLGVQRSGDTPGAVDSMALLGGDGPDIKWTQANELGWQLAGVLAQVAAQQVPSVDPTTGATIEAALPLGRIEACILGSAALYHPGTTIRVGSPVNVGSAAGSYIGGLLGNAGGTVVGGMLGGPVGSLVGGALGQAGGQAAGGALGGAAGGVPASTPGFAPPAGGAPAAGGQDAGVGDALAALAALANAGAAAAGTGGGGVDSDNADDTAFANFLEGLADTFGVTLDI